MNFNLFGEPIPLKSFSTDPSKPVKVRLVKRGKSLLTTILNLKMSHSELEKLAGDLKKKLGCGGGVQDMSVEIQGDKVDQVKDYLLKMGIKSQ